MSAAPLEKEVSAAPGSIVELHPASHPEAHCPNCSAMLSNRFCTQCGQQRLHAGDLSLKHAWHHVTHEWLHLDGRIFSTVRTLFLRPGQLTVDFIEGRRARYVHPIRLFLVFFFLFFLFAPLNPRFDLGLQLSQGIQGPARVQLAARAEQQGKSVEQILDAAALQTTAAYKSIDMVVIVASGFFLWLCFGRRRRFLAENIVMGLHLASFNMSVVLTIGWLMMLPGGAGVIAGAALMIPPFVYFLFAARRVYGGSWAGIVGKYILLELIKILIFGAALIAVFIRSLAASLSGAS
jgi:hypothetical protein